MRTASRTTWPAARLGMAAVAAGALVGDRGRRGPRGSRRPAGAAEAAGLAVAAKAGCTSHTAACLRALPVSAVVDNEDFTGYRPDIDGRVLTQSIVPALASGQFNHVPVIIGTNHDEWRLFVAQPSSTAGRRSPRPTTRRRSPQRSAFPPPSRRRLRRSTRSPAIQARPSRSAPSAPTIFACPALTADQSLSKYVPAYAYEFNDENAPERYLPPVGFPYGAALPRPSVETTFAAEHHCGFWAEAS
jgi:para-nitrobenzyl esterase